MILKTKEMMIMMIDDNDKEYDEGNQLPCA